MRERKQASGDHRAGGGVTKRQREGAGTQRGGTKRQKYGEAVRKRRREGLENMKTGRD